MRTPESFEKVEIDKYLKQIGAYVVKPTAMGFGASGTADRVCCLNGLFFVIEVKREGKEPTVIQNTRMDEVRAAGGWACWGTAEKVIAEIDAWRMPSDH